MIIMQQKTSGYFRAEGGARLLSCQELSLNGAQARPPHALRAGEGLAGKLHGQDEIREAIEGGMTKTGYYTHLYGQRYRCEVVEYGPPASRDGRLMRYD